jgi:hypothetical protein
MIVLGIYVAIRIVSPMIWIAMALLVIFGLVLRAIARNRLKRSVRLGSGWFHNDQCNST